MRSIDLGEMRRIAVLNTGTGDTMGEITDIIVQPTEGRLLGIIVKTGDGEESVLPVSAFRIGENAVMAATDAPLEVRSSSPTLQSGVAAGAVMVGANVVTEDGRLLGKINDVIVLPELALVAYKVTESVLQKIFGGGFYIAGDLPSVLSADGHRVIVPSDTEQRHAAGSIEGLFSKRADESAGEAAQP